MDTHTTLLIVLIAATAVLVVNVLIVNQAINILSKDIDNIADCHNLLASVVKDICDSLNGCGIPAPEIKPKSEEK